MVEDSDGPEMMMRFLYTIIKRYPNLNPDSERSDHVRLNCSCHLATHEVSHRGFVLLEEAQIILESRELSVLEVLGSVSGGTDFGQQIFFNQRVYWFMVKPITNV